MFKKILKTLFGDPNERELKKLWPLVDEVNEEFRKLQDLSDEELQAKTDEFKERLQEEVADIEERQEEMEAAMADPDAYEGDGVRARELSDEYNALKKELSSLYETWEALTEHVMALED